MADVHIYVYRRCQATRVRVQLAFFCCRTDGDARKVGRRS